MRITSIIAVMLITLALLTGCARRCPYAQGEVSASTGSSCGAAASSCAAAHEKSCGCPKCKECAHCGTQKKSCAGK